MASSLGSLSESRLAYDAPALRKGIRLLELLCESSGPLGVAEISRRLNLNKHMVLRLLGTLSDEGWVVAEPGPVYRISLLPLAHFSKPLGQTDVVRAAEGAIDELWATTGDSTSLAACDAGRSVGVVLRPSRRDVQVVARPGARMLMHCCAPGKVLLAHATPELFNQLAAEGFEQKTDNTFSDPTRLRAELSEIVRRGYGVDNEEYLRGNLCLAAPVFDYTGKVVAAVGITTLTLYHTRESMLAAYVEPVTAAARRISTIMGHAAKE
jgi:IclR family transcriptional regulator, KDG regulon repressor